MNSLNINVICLSLITDDVYVTTVCAVVMYEWKVWILTKALITGLAELAGWGWQGVGVGALGKHH